MFTVRLLTPWTGRVTCQCLAVTVMMPYRTKLFLKVHQWVRSLRESAAEMVMGGYLPLFRERGPWPSQHSLWERPASPACTSCAELSSFWHTQAAHPACWVDGLLRHMACPSEETGSSILSGRWDGCVYREQEIGEYPNPVFTRVVLYLKSKSSGTGS